MSHVNIASNIAIFNGGITAANGVGKEYVLGEMNSASGGGASSVSPTFGAGIWTLDYILRTSLAGIKRSYFHHGTLGLCYYCWWEKYSMGSPYYGAYAATAAMAGGPYISALDTGSTNYAVCVVYDSVKTPLRAVLINSDYYSESGTRENQTFVLKRVLRTSLKAKRLTAASALSRVDQGSSPSFGDQKFVDGMCIVGGAKTFESVGVVGGSATFVVAGSEALVVYLK